MATNANTATATATSTTEDTDSTNSIGSVRSYDVQNMKVALEQSIKAYTNDCMPFGAALADSNGNICAIAANVMPASKSGQRGGSQSQPCDPTGHAEIALLRTKEFINLPRSQRLTSTLYSSTEPCVMCAGAIYWSGVGRIVYGCNAKDLETKISGPGGFDIPIRTLYSIGEPDKRRCIEIVGPLLGEEALDIHRQSGVWSNLGSNSSGISSSITSATTTGTTTGEDSK